MDKPVRIDAEADPLTTPHEALAELVTKPGEMAAGVTSGRRAGLDLHGDDARRRNFGEEVPHEAARSRPGRRVEVGTLRSREEKPTRSRVRVDGSLDGPQDPRSRLPLIEQDRLLEAAKSR